MRGARPSRSACGLRTFRATAGSPQVHGDVQMHPGPQGQVGAVAFVVLLGCSWRSPVVVLRPGRQRRPTLFVGADGSRRRSITVATVAPVDSSVIVEAKSYSGSTHTPRSLTLREPFVPILAPSAHDPSSIAFAALAQSSASRTSGSSLQDRSVPDHRQTHTSRPSMCAWDSFCRRPSLTVNPFSRPGSYRRATRPVAGEETRPCASRDMHRVESPRSSAAPARRAVSRRPP